MKQVVSFQTLEQCKVCEVPSRAFPCKLNDDTKKNMFGRNEFRKGIVGLYTSKDAPKRKRLLGGIGLSSTISAGLGVKVTTEVCRYWEAKETKSQTSKHQHVLYGGCPQGVYLEKLQ